MGDNTWHAWLGILGLLASLTVGCGTTKPSKFYLLTSQIDAKEAESREVPGPYLGVGPVEIPEYLNRPQMVTHTGTNEVQVAEYDRWAEPIKANVARVLGDNLSLLLATEGVSLFPARGATPPDWRVTLTITDLEIQFGESVVLSGWWRLLRGNEDETLASHKVHILEPLGENESYEGAALAASRTLARLSREMAAAIEEAGKASKLPANSPSQK
jgi:uncharacterized lipoprotein YmbA